MKARISLGMRCTSVFMFIVTFIVVSVVMSVAGNNPQPDVDLYAVIVGINRYANPKFNLRYAAKDARDFFHFIKERRNLFRNVYVALRLNEKATRASIAEAIRVKLQPARKQDIALIYLAGHGCGHPVMKDEFYFLPHDMSMKNLYGTALLMNDERLFRGIKSERVLLLADSCKSGGYLKGLSGASASFKGFDSLHGRFGISAASEDEVALEPPKFGNGLFTFFLLKGLRGSAETDRDGIITVQELYEYIAQNTKRETNGKQNPQLYCTRGSAKNTPAFLTYVYSTPLRIDLMFQYDIGTGDKRILTQGQDLRSGSKVGVWFKPYLDCFVHILWWDSTGNVGRLFPNPELTQGTGRVGSGKEYWLPLHDGRKHWYVLDNNPGMETIYFAVSRDRSEKLEQLYAKLRKAVSGNKSETQRQKAVERLEREINLMGHAERNDSPNTRGHSTNENGKSLQPMETLQVSGSDAFYKLRFKHVAD